MLWNGTSSQRKRYCALCSVPRACRTPFKHLLFILIIMCIRLLFIKVHSLIPSLTHTLSTTSFRRCGCARLTFARCWSVDRLVSLKRGSPHYVADWNRNCFTTVGSWTQPRARHESSVRATYCNTVCKTRRGREHRPLLCHLSLHIILPSVCAFS
jgi:hypothetical protein